MGIQVQELIDKIKSEGVNAARDEAARIVDAARAEAAKIESEAERKAGETLALAKESAAREVASGREALAQASRDAILQLGKDMQKAMDRVVSREVKAAYGESTLKEIIPALVSTWKRVESDDLSVLLSPEDLAKLEAFFAEKLKAEVAKGLSFKASAGVKSGFKVQDGSGAAYFDFSSDALSEIISRRLNPSLADIVRKAARERS